MPVALLQSKIDEGKAKGVPMDRMLLWNYNKPFGSLGGMTMEEVERAHILAVLESTGWRVSGPGGAADFLGVKPTTLEYRMKKLGVERRR